MCRAKKRTKKDLENDEKCLLSDQSVFYLFNQLKTMINNKNNTHELRNIRQYGKFYKETNVNQYFFLIYNHFPNLVTGYFDNAISKLKKNNIKNFSLENINNENFKQEVQNFKNNLIATVQKESSYEMVDEIVKEIYGIYNMLMLFVDEFYNFFKNCKNIGDKVKELHQKTHSAMQVVFIVKVLYNFWIKTIFMECKSPYVMKTAKYLENEKAFYSDLKSHRFYDNGQTFFEYIESKLFNVECKNLSEDSKVLSDQLKMIYKNDLSFIDSEFEHSLIQELEENNEMNMNYDNDSENNLGSSTNSKGSDKDLFSIREDNKFFTNKDFLEKVDFDSINLKSLITSKQSQENNIEVKEKLIEKVKPEFILKYDAYHPNNGLRTCMFSPKKNGNSEEVDPMLIKGDEISLCKSLSVNQSKMLKSKIDKNFDKSNDIKNKNIDELMEYINIPEDNKNKKKKKNPNVVPAKNKTIEEVDSKRKNNKTQSEENKTKERNEPKQNSCQNKNTEENNIHLHKEGNPSKSTKKKKHINHNHEDDEAEIEKFRIRLKESSTHAYKVIKIQPAQ